MLRPRRSPFSTTALFVAIALFSSASPALAQEPHPPEGEEATEAAAPIEGPRSPREVFERFFEYTARYIENGDEEDLHRAGRLFELDDVLKGDRTYVGDAAARDLLNFLDRALRPVNLFLVPREWDEDRYVYPVKYRARDGTIATAQIELVRDENGVWHFSRKTRRQAAELYLAVRHLEPRHGKKGIQDAATFLRDHVPDWMLGRTFLLENWQWLGLLALVLIGVIASVLGRLLTTLLRGWVLRRRGVESETKGWRRSRPFGLLAMAAVWWLLLPFLALPDRAYSALMLAVRLVAMVGATWSVCSLIDYAAEYLLTVARRTESRIDDIVVPLVRRALKIFVVAIGVVWIADNLDMDIAALLAGLSIGGLALGLAARETVENFFGTVSILGDRIFEVGDWIKFDDVEGTVERVGFRSTRIRTFYDSMITVPNALLTRAKIDNLGARRYRRIKETIGLTYDTPPEKIEAFCEGIRELIRRHPYTRKDSFHVYFHRYNDSSLDILLYLFLRTPDWATELRERHRFLVDVKRLAERLGVEFAFPTRTVHLFREERQAAEATGGGSAADLEEVRDASARAKEAARDIVRRFTGERPPPPVEGERGDSDL